MTDYFDRVSVALSAFGMVGRMRGLLSGCFVAETEVYERLQPGQATMVDAAPAANSSAEWTFAALASMGVAVAVQQREKKRCSRKSAAEGELLPDDQEPDCADCDEADGEVSKPLARRRWDFLPENEYGVRWRSYPLPEPRVANGLREARSQQLPGGTPRLKPECAFAAPSPGGCAATLSRKGRGKVAPIETQGEKKRPASGSRLGRWLPTLLLLFAAFCGWRALPDSWRMGADVRPAAAVGRQQPLFTPVPIATVRCGQKVLAGNPTGEEDFEFGDDVDPATWKLLTLRAAKQDGGWCDIQLLRPDWWLDEEEAQVGGQVDVNVPECGIEGVAEVLDIGPVPDIIDGPGRVVTGTFHHSAANVVDLYIEGLPKPLGVTGNHRFWSADRREFLPADELRLGERLHELAGEPRVERIVRRSATEPVYNLEVQVDHTYHVGQSGILVHNATACPKAILNRLTKQALKEFAEDAGLALAQLSKRQLKALEARPWLAKPLYGRAVEKRVAQLVKENRSHDRILQYKGKGAGPDFIGQGKFKGQSFEITTNNPATIAKHRARAYGRNLQIITYQPPW